MVYISARIHKYIWIMNITKLNIIFCFLLTALTASAMKYQIKVLNTPTITIDNKAAKVGDWFDDQSVIVWSRDNQAMRVVSEDNKVYTLSAKLYKESKSKKFSDFIIYTKPLAARGTNDHSLIAKLQERFDQDFIMLDEIVIDLSDIDIPQNITFHFSVKNKNEDSCYFEVKPEKGVVLIPRSSISSFYSPEISELLFNVYWGTAPNKVDKISDSFTVLMLPISID